MTHALDLRLRASIRRILVRLSCAILAASHATGAVADTAAADTAADTLDEVTVTAQRREENARDVPISLTVFDAAAIEQQNFQGVESYFADTENVSFTSEGTRDRKELSLRGISDQLSPDNNIKEGSFGFYIDEFNVAQGTSNPEIVDIDQTEVLRGPQGTYFGRNAVGGTINITTKQPTNDYFAEASAQYSSFNTVDAHVILNLPLIDHLLAVRFVAQEETSDGNIKNVNPIGGGNDSKYTYGKVIVRFTPTENLTIDVTGVATSETVGMRNGVPSGVFGDFGCELYGGSTYSKPNPGYLGATKTPFVCPYLPVDPDGLGVYPNNVNTVNYNPRSERRARALQLRHEPRQSMRPTISRSPTWSGICTRMNSRAATSMVLASTCSTRRSRSSAARSARSCASNRCPPPGVPSIGPAVSTTATTMATLTSTRSRARPAAHSSACPMAPSSPPRSATPRTTAMPCSAK